MIGAGSRGATVYGAFARQNPHRFQVVAVAEPRADRRSAMARDHEIPAERCWEDWRPLLLQPPLAPVAVIATQDRDHVECAVALMAHGYDLLLEKPMDVTAEGCRRLVAAAREHGRLVIVAHTMRYTPYFRLLKRLCQARVVGQVATVRHFEPVNYWHQAHSFVRGHWRNSQQAAPMILAKSCHDLDLVCWLLDQTPTRVASFGNLLHFKPENRPAEATDRCLDCPLAAAQCPYSASRFYLGLMAQGQTGWPLDVLTDDLTPAGVTRALREGPWGRCVYACDNDVVDHQVVAMEFASGVSATFTMTAFTDARFRETEILGSHGQLKGDGLRLNFLPFAVPPPDSDWMADAEKQADGSFLWDVSNVPTDGHNGGDHGLMEFLYACCQDRAAALQLPLPEEALRGHLLCFHAEQARLEGRVVNW